MAGCTILLFDLKDDFNDWRGEGLGLSGSLWVLDSAPDSPSGQGYRHMNIYHTSDVASIGVETVQEELSIAKAENRISRWTCHLYKEATSLRRVASHSTPPIVVSSGFTIRDDPDAVKNFEKWYNEEHMPGMSTVPGWLAATRYEHLNSIGDKDKAPAAHYIALHEWESSNGMGGEVWKKVVFTPWTDRILKTQTAPMQRTKWIAAT
ncbi:hypothetical protein BJ170DRAFT_224560 [Xylariales sp. AK1849]|nr:hypothetical protein BJ170DRAFT_224560 [Xylariales sp. AK1849]